MLPNGRCCSKEPGVRGIARVCKEGYPDYNAWDPKHPCVTRAPLAGRSFSSGASDDTDFDGEPTDHRYYDPKSKEDNPTWYMVDVEVSSSAARSSLYRVLSSK